MYEIACFDSANEESSTLVNIIKYISLLRGINVGGKNRIKMDALVMCYESLGFSQVKTYIQSGNVIFESTERDKSSLQRLLEEGIKNEFGLNISIFIVSKEDLVEVLNNFPFGEVNKIEDSKRLMVSLLSEVPTQIAVRELWRFVSESEKLHIAGKVLYLYCSPKGYRYSKLSNNFIENKLKVIATTRNWKTVTTLYELCLQST